jgi:hypothetical protein
MCLCRKLNSLDVRLHQRALELLQERRQQLTAAGSLQQLPNVTATDAATAKKGANSGERHRVRGSCGGAPAVAQHPECLLAHQSCQRKLQPSDCCCLRVAAVTDAVGPEHEGMQALGPSNWICPEPCWHCLCCHPATAAVQSKRATNNGALLG